MTALRQLANRLGAPALATGCLILLLVGAAEAQRRIDRPERLPPAPVRPSWQLPAPPTAPPAPKAQPPDAKAQPAPPTAGPAAPAAPADSSPAAPAAAPAATAALPPETVQADVSQRSVAVTSSFTGTELIVFGAVNHSRQETAEAGLYQVVIVVEGAPTRVTSRKKSKVGGIWLNTESVAFDGVPSFYAIESTSPIDEVAPEATLRENRIGFDNVPMEPAPSARGADEVTLKTFRDAIVRLKRKEGLYVQEDYGIVFTGPSLFRAAVELPAHVTVGPYELRVYLFRDGKLLDQYAARLTLQRQGLEQILHTFAFGYPLYYGIASVLIAIASGLIASAIFSRASH